MWCVFILSLVILYCLYLNFGGLRKYLRSVRLATPAKVVMGTLGISRSITKEVFPQPKTIVFYFTDSEIGFDYIIAL